MIHPTAIIHPAADVSGSAEIGPFVVIEGGVLIEHDVTIHAFAHIGREPKAAGVIARQPTAMRDTRISSGSVIGSHVVIYRGVWIDGKVLIGDGTAIRENSSVGRETVIGSHCTVQNGATIGARVKIVDLSHITFDCEIGDEAFLSVGVYTMNDNSMQRGGEIVGPKIGARARVGGGALLLPGVRIGEDAVVGAGAVVTKDVAPAEQVLGIPARVRAPDQRPREVFGGYTDDELFEMYFVNPPRWPEE